jgi:glycosyltransferase involved in cell wall biosynthesis
MSYSHPQKRKHLMPAGPEAQIATPADDKRCDVAAAVARTRVAYIMSRFPKLTETFILFEMLAAEREGLDVEVYPLLRARNTAAHPEAGSFFGKVIELTRRPNSSVVMHPEAAHFVDRAHFTPLFSLGILISQAVMLLRRPYRYLSALWTVIRANFGSTNYLLGGLAFFPKAVHFARLMKADGIDHIHAHFANHPAAVAWVIHRLTDIPYSFTAHGADLQVDQHMLREKVAAADRVITVSDDNKRLIADVCGASCEARVWVLRCGVDTDVFYPAQRGAERVRSKSLTIVCTGTLYEVKGQNYLIEACRRLHDQGLSLTCHLVGDGPWREKLEMQAVESGLCDQIRFRGRMRRHEIASLLHSADVLVAPSVPTAAGRREGIPVVLMEAMASGLPVIASNISGIPELVENGRSGLLVEPRQPDQLADALMRLHGDPELRDRLGKQGRQRVMDEYDLHKNTAALAAYFRDKVTQ